MSSINNNEMKCRKRHKKVSALKGLKGGGGGGNTQDDNKPHLSKYNLEKKEREEGVIFEILARDR